MQGMIARSLICVSDINLIFLSGFSVYRFHIYKKPDLSEVTQALKY
jgi:hypothetical protein